MGKIKRGEVHIEELGISFLDLKFLVKAFRAYDYLNFERREVMWDFKQAIKKGLTKKENLANIVNELKESPWVKRRIEAGEGSVRKELDKYERKMYIHKAASYVMAGGVGASFIEWASSLREGGLKDVLYGAALGACLIGTYVFGALENLARFMQERTEYDDEEDKDLFCSQVWRNYAHQNTNEPSSEGE